MTKIERTEKWFAILALAFAWAYKTGKWLESKKKTPLKKHGRKTMSCFRRGYDLIRKTLFDYAHPLQHAGKQLENIIPPWRKRQKITKTDGEWPKNVNFCPVR